LVFLSPQKKELEIEEFAENWGIDFFVLSDSVNAYSV